MSRLMRLAGALALAAGICAVPVAKAAACSCAAMTPEEAAASAEIVFSGTVVHQEPTDGKGMGVAVPVGGVAMDVPVHGRLPIVAAIPADLGPMLYAFEVDGVAKGNVGPQAIVLGGGDGASCGMSFGVNERWLVFASVQGEALATSLCAGNVLLAADEEPPIAVTPPSGSPGAEGTGFGFPVAIVLPVAVVAALIGASAYMFWRADRPT